MSGEPRGQLHAISTASASCLHMPGPMCLLEE
jgi:hypothetical protein